MSTSAPKPELEPEHGSLSLLPPCCFTKTSVPSCSGNVDPGWIVCKGCALTHAVYLCEAAAEIQDPKLMALAEQIRELRECEAHSMGMHTCITESFNDTDAGRLGIKYVGFEPEKSTCPPVVLPLLFCDRCRPLAEKAGVCDSKGQVRPRCVFSDTACSEMPFYKEWTASPNCSRTSEENEVCNACFEKFDELAKQDPKAEDMWDLYFDTVNEGRGKKLNKDMAKYKKKSKAPEAKSIERLRYLNWKLPEREQTHYLF